MRGLNGDVGTMPVKDLVVYLGNRKVSGRLTLERGSVRKEILLKDGQVVNVHSNEPREYLGQFLINMGQITEEQFDKAFQAQKETHIYLGKILCMTGAVSEQTVMNALSLKFRETLLEPFQWTEGTFLFEPGVEGQMPDGLDLSLSLLDLHREGEFRETAWSAIRGAFPSGDLRLILARGNLPQPLQAGSLDARIADLIDAGHTLDEMVLALHATDFFLYQRLFALHRLDAIRIDEPEDESFALIEEELLTPTAPKQELGEGASSAEILGHAELFLSSGNADGAEALARKAHQLEPSAQTLDVLRRAEAALLVELRAALMGGKKIPSLIVPPSKLKAMPMGAPERYLLSKIDGIREVAAIVHVSPLRELEALKYLQRFIDSGLVKVA